MSHHITIDRAYHAKAEHIGENQMQFIALSLRIAADIYAANARLLESKEGQYRLVAQFRRQAIEAMEIAWRFENAESGLLVTDTAGE